MTDDVVDLTVTLGVENGEEDIPDQLTDLGNRKERATKSCYFCLQVKALKGSPLDKRVCSFYNGERMNSSDRVFLQTKEV
ncbi:hypothetical protein [Salsuginibacillus kocurii]|uniref:hypothetical protein n=1 Tax=Salsuginibacillus kocurii TaxID=427078 RepID=UPI000375CED8|nr:hypothetical protein [Salsuginibacillus kocurii]